jgi:hypothetical protein
LNDAKRWVKEPFMKSRVQAGVRNRAVLAIVVLGAALSAVAGGGTNVDFSDRDQPRP